MGADLAEEFGLRECRGSVGDRVNNETLADEIARENLGDRLVIIDDEDASAWCVHRFTVSPGARSAKPRDEPEVLNDFETPLFSRLALPAPGTDARKLRTREGGSMKRLIARVLVIAAGATALVGVQNAQADDGSGGNGNKASAVFVQTNEPSGNRIVVYDRGADGQLTFAGTYATGGNGGVNPVERICNLWPRRGRGTPDP